MNIPKKYLHDRLILLLLSVNGFLAFIGSLLVLFKLDADRSASYTVQYRENLGISAQKQGTIAELIAFIIFLVLVFVVHGLLSVRVYPIRREVSVILLLLGILLLITAMITANALLGLR